MKWIDIEVTDPEFDVPILVTGENRVAIARLLRKVVSSTSDSSTKTFEFLEGDSGHETLWITPTHWMPIPDAT